MRFSLCIVLYRIRLEKNGTLAVLGTKSDLVRNTVELEPDRMHIEFIFQPMEFCLN